MSGEQFLFWTNTADVMFYVACAFTLFAIGFGIYVWFENKFAKGEKDE
jgi:hypothetical protein